MTGRATAPPPDDLKIELRHPTDSDPESRPGTGEFVFDRPDQETGVLVCVLGASTQWQVIEPKSTMPLGVSDDNFVWCDPLDSLQRDQDGSINIVVKQI